MGKFTLNEGKNLLIILHSVGSKTAILLLSILITISFNSCEEGGPSPYSRGYDAGYNAGKQKGREEGIEEGRKKGIDEGEKLGIEIGIKKGEEIGYEKGQYDVGYKMGYKAGYQDAYDLQWRRENFMDHLLYYITILLVVCGYVLVLFFIILLIFKSTDLMERAIRSIAFFFPILVYFSSIVLNIKISDFIANSFLQEDLFVKYGAGIVLPLIVGYFTAYYLLKVLEKSDNLSYRIVIIIAIFTLVLFIDVMAKSLSTKLVNEKLLASNALFISGLALNIIIRFDRAKLRLKKYISSK